MFRRPWPRSTMLHVRRRTSEGRAPVKMRRRIAANANRDTSSSASSSRSARPRRPSSSADALVVIGGLSLSTLVTLFAVPTFYVAARHRAAPPLRRRLLARLSRHDASDAGGDLRGLLLQGRGHSVGGKRRPGRNL